MTPPGAAGSDPLVRLDRLSVGYGRAPVLRDVTLAVAPAEIVTVVGPNGSGKSTLVQALIGTLRPSRGTVWRRPGLGLGYVPQRLAVDATMPMTVGRFLSLPRRGARAEARAEARAALARVGLAGAERRQIADLSGGQLQRALLARAILGRPDLLVLDEPTQGLDQPGTADFYRLIEELRAELGCAVLMVSHDLHVVMSASDRVICLNGHVCCEGTPEIVSGAPEYRALFGHGTRGALALYRHEHDHSHEHDHRQDIGHDTGHGHGHDRDDGPGPGRGHGDGGAPGAPANPG